MTFKIIVQRLNNTILSFLKLLQKKTAYQLLWFRGAYKYFRWFFTSLQIRIKLIIIIGLLFTLLMSVFGFLIIQNGKTILQERLDQTCNLSLRHVSETIKNDLLLYQSTTNDKSHTQTLGHIRETVLGIMKEDIAGLLYTGVTDREGTIIAHTTIDQINQKISEKDSVLFSNLKTTMKRSKEKIIEYIHPIIIKRENGKKIFLGTVTLGFSRDIIVKPIQRVTQSIIYATFLIIIIAIIAIFYVAQRMTRQIDVLTIGVKKVSTGNLKSEIPVLSNDELGQLANEFNSMVGHLREKLHMQKFVSKLTVEMIRHRSRMDLSPTGEQRQVTLLFSDVRNFTALTEKSKPEEIVKLVNIYLDLQSRIIEEKKGIVDKFMGDQVMAIFLGEKQADNAVQAAIEVQRAIRDLNKKRFKKGEIVFTVGCGLNIGSAVMGNMGSQSRLDYTVIGDVVNLASRLCSIAEAGEILAPTEMFKHLEGTYPTITLNPVTVKGKSQPVEIFRIDYDHSVLL